MPNCVQVTLYPFEPEIVVVLPKRVAVYDVPSEPSIWVVFPNLVLVYDVPSDRSVVAVLPKRVVVELVPSDHSVWLVLPKFVVVELVPSSYWQSDIDPNAVHDDWASAAAGTASNPRDRHSARFFISMASGEQYARSTRTLVTR